MYIVIELQTWADGSMHEIVVPNAGHDPEKTAVANFEEAKSAWHNVLTYAAVSTNPVHSAVILDETGAVIAIESYDRRYREESAE